MGSTRVPPRGAQAALDLILLSWAVLWVVAGVAVARLVGGLAEISDTVANVGRTTTTVGETLRALPIVGGSLAGPADEIAQAGRDAVTSARAARTSADELATLLGLSDRADPEPAAAAAYVPARIAGARERRSLARVVAAGREPWVDELLAQRALVHLPLRRLRAISDDPLADLRAGRHRELAAAELDWFGVDAELRVRR